MSNKLDLNNKIILDIKDKYELMTKSSTYLKTKDISYEECIKKW